MDGKKISFGFSKITKKPALLPSKIPKPEENKKELIKCLEGQEIKLVQEQKEAAPLVITLREGGKTSAALASLAKRRAVLLGEDDEPETTKNNGESNQAAVNGAERMETQSIDKRAEMEILADLKAKTEEATQADLVLPVVKPDELPLDGAKASTLDDYESIPIEKYGWAMLRGMGAVEPPKSEQKQPIDSGPVQRPAGLGLGADKAIKPKPLLEAPEANEKLEIKKQACVRILAGKFKDYYGQIEGFDNERGTIIVKLAIGGAKQKFQEFLCQPVSKKEYAQYGKCINKAKYEEYKKLENEHGQIVLKKEEHSTKVKAENFESKNNIKTESNSKFKTEMSKSSSSFEQRLKSSDDLPASSNSSITNRYRSRSRSPRRQRYRSRSFENGKNRSSSLDSESDSTYERRRKPKSYRNKSSKKKHRHYSSSDDSDSSKKHRRNSSQSDDSEDERHYRRKSDKKKKSKKKTKKSKRERSRTPSRRR